MGAAVMTRVCQSDDRAASPAQARRASAPGRGAALPRRSAREPCWQVHHGIG